VKVEHVPALIITCPEWYRRADFREMLERYTKQVHGQRRLATWYYGEGVPEAGSEVFFTAESPTGVVSEFSEMDIFPGDIEDTLAYLLAEHMREPGLVMLRNNPEPFDDAERLSIAHAAYSALAPCDGQLAGDLADLMAAIMAEDHCAWPESRLIVQLLRERLPQDAAVWQFVSTHEGAIVHGRPFNNRRQQRD
jgi:hypothetical protein